MDVVLEGLDKYMFDHVFAALFPLAGHQGGANATYSSMREAPTSAANSFEFKPASAYFQFTPTQTAYMTSVPRDNIWRQLLELVFIVWVFGLVVYYVFATLSYMFIFDKATFNHPKYLKNQMQLEIRQAHQALPVMAILTAPIMLAEVRGYSKLYDTSDQGPGRWYDLAQFPFFLLFTDMCIYWIHRGLHTKLIYKHLHKPHHKWIMPTPYASHAFHPLDGYAQGLPYHLFPFLFPLQKFAYIVLFMIVNIWTVMIHDGEYYAKSEIINGAACHTLHHLYFNYNYGQYTTLWDRLGGSYRRPNDELYQKELKMGQQEWARQVKEMETIVQEVEGKDERSYTDEKPGESKKVQ